MRRKRAIVAEWASIGVASIRREEISRKSSAGDVGGRADALTDGLMLLRYLFGLRGAALINGAIGPGATRTTAADIQAHIQFIMP